MAKHVTPHVMTDAAKIGEFLYAGRATFTIKSLASGEHYTYSLNKADDAERWFLSVRAGDAFVYVGTILKRMPYGLLHLTKKSRYSHDALCVKAFNYFHGHLIAGKIAPKLEFRHEGECGRCGRPLTHPDSIDSGFGPICTRAMATGSNEIDDEPHNLLLAG